MTDFVRIITSSPVNSQAARQMARGEVFTPSVKILDYYADMPKLKCIKAEHYGGAMFQDYTGRVFGRLTVVGLMDKESNTPASWVCRCKCGGYCSRTTKSLRKADSGANSVVLMCGLCDYTDKLRRGWSPNLKARKP